VNSTQLAGLTLIVAKWINEEMDELISATNDNDRTDALLDALGVIIAALAINGESANLVGLGNFARSQTSRGRTLGPLYACMKHIVLQSIVSITMVQQAHKMIVDHRWKA
jgi:hypothetical protein